jgi:hypothetical protein
MMSLILVAGFALLTADSMTLSQPQLLQTIAQCREIQHEQQRLQCFDQLAATVASQAKSLNAHPTPEQSSSNQTTQRQAQPSHTANTSAASTDKVQPDPVADFGQEQRRLTKLDELTAQIHSVKRDKLKKLVITLSNNQVWKQTDSAMLDLKTGDQIVIKRAALGSFLLGKANVNTKIRVKRQQ